MESLTLEEKVRLVMRQTNYTEEVAREKLASFAENEVAVIRDYFGIHPKSTLEQVTSVNQAIYKQIRNHLRTQK